MTVAFLSFKSPRIGYVLLLLAFIPGCTAHSNEPTVNPETVTAGKEIAPDNKGSLLAGKKVEVDKKLQAESDALLPLFGKMLSVPVYIVDEPIIENGKSSTERSIAYTICENKDQPTIFVKKVFWEKQNDKQITNALKHELTHAWFCRQEIRAEHDERFRKKFAGIGGYGR
jgi:hypothetical protein